MGLSPESIPAPKTNGVEASSSDRLRPYGIDTSTAGTIQERYFMILAGLLDKNLAVNLEIRDALVTLNKTIATNKISETVPHAISDDSPARQGKKTR